MSECKTIDPLITPYVDGDIDAAGRTAVDSHVRACPPCHSRVASERAVRDLVRTRRTDIAVDTAPDALRARCTALGATSAIAAGTRADRSADGSRSFAGATLVTGGRGFSRAFTGRAIKP